MNGVSGANVKSQLSKAIQAAAEAQAAAAATSKAIQEARNAKQSAQ